MERKEVLDYVMDPNYVPDLQWKGERGPIQFYESLRTGNLLAIDADTLTYYDRRMREIHPVDAQALVGIYHPNSITTEQINAHVHEGREDVFVRSASPTESGAVLSYERLDYEPRGGYGIDYIYLEQHRYTGGLIRSDVDGHYFDDQLHPISQHDALAGMVNYGPAGGTLEKLPPMDMELLRPPAESRNAAEGWQRSVPEQDPATTRSVEAAYPKEYIPSNYFEAMERWETAVHLHEDLRGRPLTPQEYQQQLDINGPRWQHDLVLAQPVDGAQSLYDRPYTQITQTDQILSPAQYEQAKEHYGPNWQHSVILREPFPLDPDSRFQEAHRAWLEANTLHRESHSAEPSPQHFGMELPTSWRMEGRSVEQAPWYGEQVIPYAKSDWTVEQDGLWEHRVHFGKSDDGFHYATEFSYRGGDSGGGELAWNGPYASHNEAINAAQHQIAQTVSGDTGYGISL